MAALLAEPQGTSMRRVAMASFVGSAIEYYDFYIYGTAAALVFPKVFFPHLGATIATVASMATFAAAFLSRPVGAAFFGHFGDRLGRKSTLIATLMIMGLSTFAVGLVPGAATVGTAAPLILLTLRLLQGFAVGGEWAGSALMSAEYAPAEARGRYGMFTQMGVGSGLVMSSLLFLVVNQTIGEASHAFLAWRWRIPFLFSAVLIAIALYVRLNVAETPVFAAQQARKTASVTPLAALFRNQRREVVLAAGSMIGFFILGYMANAYLMSCAHAHVGFGAQRYLRSPLRHHGGADGWRSVGVCRAPADRHRQCRVVRAGDVGHLRDRRELVRPDGGVHPGDLRHPVPLQRSGAVAQPRGVGRRRRADDHRRAVAGDVGCARDRRHDGGRRGRQPRLHRRTTGDERRCAGLTPVSRTFHTSRILGEFSTGMERSQVRR